VPTGAVGPTGPAGGGLLIFGGMFSDIESSATFNGNINTTVVLPEPTPATGIVHDALNSTLTVSSTGVYEVHYKINYTPTFIPVETAFLSIGVLVNDITVVTETHLLTSGVENSVFGTMLFVLASNDVVSLAINPTENVTFTFLGGVNAIVTLKQLQAL